MTEMLLIDTHCHLADEKLKAQLPALLDRGRRSGVGAVVGVGDTLERSRETADIAEQYPNVFATAGVHPHHAEEWTAAMEEGLRALIGERGKDAGGRIIAVGEIGLDYYYEFAPRQAQREILKRQTAIARDFELPVILHCREAWDEMLDFIETENVGRDGGILHCFAGSAEQARRAVKQGLYLGVGGILTFKRSDAMRKVIVELGPEHLVLETDAPYLAPVPKRGKTNEPALMVHTAERLSELLDIPMEELRELLYRNTCQALRCEGCFG